MFGKKKNSILVVDTKEELKEAIKRKEPVIEVRGELVQKMKWMAKLSPGKVSALVGVLAVAVIPTSPTATVSLTAVTGIVGKDAAAIILTGTLSISIILAVLKGYSVELGAGDRFLRLNAK